MTAILQNSKSVNGGAKRSKSSKSLEYHKTIPVAKISMKDIMNQNLEGNADN